MTIINLYELWGRCKLAFSTRGSKWESIERHANDILVLRTTTLDQKHRMNKVIEGKVFTPSFMDSVRIYDMFLLDFIIFELESGEYVSGK